MLCIVFYGHCWLAYFACISFMVPFTGLGIAVYELQRLFINRLVVLYTSAYILKN